MTPRLWLLVALASLMAVSQACSTKPVRKCNGYYHDVREFGFCDLGPNRARDLTMPF